MPSKTNQGSKQTTAPAPAPTRQGSLVVRQTPVLEGPISCDAVCVDVQARETQYGPYVDFYLKPEHEELLAAVGGKAVKFGVPMRLNSESLLGQYCSKFGVKAGADGNADLSGFIGTRWDVNFVKEEREVRDDDGTMTTRKFWNVEKSSVRQARDR